jgi:hypothetical protein
MGRGPVTGNGVAVRERESWEKLKGESYKAWEAFTVYRDMGPTRTLARAGQHLGKGRAIIEEWSAKHHWVDRASDYDEYLDRQQREVMEDARRKMLETHAEVASTMVAKASQRLTGDPDNNVLALNVNRLSPQDVARWLELGSKTERLARGEPTEFIRGALYVAPEELSRIAGGLIEIALRHIPEGEQPSFVREVESFASTVGART